MLVGYSLCIHVTRMYRYIEISMYTYGTVYIKNELHKSGYSFKKEKVKSSTKIIYVFNEEKRGNSHMTKKRR